jgi:hypothetical protein
MSALAALILLASTTPRLENSLAEATLVCTCNPASVTALPSLGIAESNDPRARMNSWGLAAGATAVALFGGSLAAHLHSGRLEASPTGRATTLGLDAGHWNAASTAMLVSGAALAGFSAAFFLFRF